MVGDDQEFDDTGEIPVVDGGARLLSAIDEYAIEMANRAARRREIINGCVGVVIGAACLYIGIDLLTNGWLTSLWKKNDE